MQLKLGNTVLAEVDEAGYGSILRRFHRPGVITNVGLFDRHEGNCAELAIWIKLPIKETSGTVVTIVQQEEG